MIVLADRFIGAREKKTHTHTREIRPSVTVHVRTSVHTLKTTQHTYPPVVELKPVLCPRTPSGHSNPRLARSPRATAFRGELSHLCALSTAALRLKRSENVYDQNVRGTAEENIEGIGITCASSERQDL